MHDKLKMGTSWVKTQLHYLRYINALVGNQPTILLQVLRNWDIVEALGDI